MSTSTARRPMQMARTARAGLPPASDDREALRSRLMAVRELLPVFARETAEARRSAARMRIERDALRRELAEAKAALARAEGQSAVG